MWTSAPGEVVGGRGAGAAQMRDRLRAALPDASLELQVHAGSEPFETAERFQLSDDVVLGQGAPGHDLVPDLVGMSLQDAHTTARFSGFALSTSDPDGVPIGYYLAHGELGHWTVVGQSPLPGVLAPLHSSIVVAIDERGGGEAGDREPRIPHPPKGVVGLERAIEYEDFC